MTNPYLQSTVSKWNSTGLLTGLNSKEKEDLANKLESLLDDVMYGDSIHTTESFKGIKDLKNLGLLEMLWPIQRRIKEHKISLKNNELRVDGRKFITISQFIERATQIKEDLSHYIPLTDCELCKILAEEMEVFAVDRAGDYHTFF